MVLRERIEFDRQRQEFSNIIDLLDRLHGAVPRVCPTVHRPFGLRLQFLALAVLRWCCLVSRRDCALADDPSAPMFCLGLGPEHHAKLAALRADEGLYQPEAGVLCSSLDAAISVASLPFTLALDTAHSLRFQGFHIAERIRAQALSGVSRKEAESIAAMRAQERFSAEMDNVETFKAHMKGVVARLESFLVTLGPAVMQLNSETLVMLWGAFEVFATDVIRKRLNLRPDEALRLVNEDPAKKRVNLRSVPMDRLAEFGLDLRERMGDVVLANVSLSSLEVLRDVASVLLPKAQVLHVALASPDLRLLWKRRNLIAHRGGVVDRAYVAAGVEPATVEERLVVARDAIENSLDVVLATAQGMLDALNGAD